jgi:arylsulfatase
MNRGSVCGLHDSSYQSIPGRKQRVTSLVLKMSISLDGYVAPTDGSTDWQTTGRSDDGGAWVLDTVSNAGKPVFCHNLLTLQRFKVYGDKPVPAGTHQVRMEFAYDGGGLAKGGNVTLYVDGTTSGEGRVDATVPMIYSGDETCDLGTDTGTPVSDDYTPDTRHFTGTVNWVQLDAGDDDQGHLITPEERLRVAMARQ